MTSLRLGHDRAWMMIMPAAKPRSRRSRAPNFSVHFVQISNATRIYRMAKLSRIVYNTLLCAAVVAPVLARAQSLKPGEWRTYTSMRSVTDVALASDSIHAWAASGGGAFEVDLRNRSEERRVGKERR